MSTAHYYRRRRLTSRHLAIAFLLGAALGFFLAAVMR
jgi:hypothetical protein